MLKLDRVIVPLKVLLVLLFLGLIVAEVLSVPGQFMESAREIRPEFAHIPWLMLVFSILVGVGFGLYPARRAGDMDPVTALRYE